MKGRVDSEMFFRFCDFLSEMIVCERDESRYSTTMRYEVGDMIIERE